MSSEHCSAFLLSSKLFWTHLSSSQLFSTGLTLLASAQIFWTLRNYADLFSALHSSSPVYSSQHFSSRHLTLVECEILPSTTSYPEVLDAESSYTQRRFCKQKAFTKARETNEPFANHAKETQEGTRKGYQNQMYMWSVECKVWSLGCKVKNVNVECKMWSVQCEV